MTSSRVHEWLRVTCGNPCLVEFIWKKSDDISHYNDVTMSVTVSQITSRSTVYRTVCLGCHKRKHQSPRYRPFYYGDVIMCTIASQITSLAIVFSTVYSDADQRKHKSSPHKWPVTRKMFPFDVWSCMRGIHRTPHKGPVTWKTFPLHGVIMNVSYHVSIPGWRTANRWFV